MTALLLTALAAGSAQAQTSVVPALISYQGRVTAANGTLVGDTTPVNRKITFRIWNHASDALPANLIYAESQTATIAGGEFSVMIGQGTALAGDLSKGPPTLKISDLGVFGGTTAATRYLGVTVDDGSGGYNVEISPRQQIVTSAYAFRAKYAEQIGANGTTTITSLDNGNVGIGNASPSSKLDVGGAIRASGATSGGGYMFNTGDTDGGIFSPADGTMTFWTNASEKLRLAPGGNVGVGTINPLTKLDVAGNISATPAGGYVFGDGDTDSGMFSPGDNNVTFKTGNVERMRINNTGLVGIGTTGPGYSLEVRGATPEIAIGTSTGTNGALYLGNAGHGVKRNYAGTANDVGLYTTDGKIHLSAAGASAGQLVVTPAGDVGIGTSSPGARLQVTASNSSGTSHMQVLPGFLNGVNTANAITFDVPNTLGGTFSFWDNLVVSGNVGVGNTSPGAKLDVSGVVRASGGGGAVPTSMSGGFMFSSGDVDGGIFSPADNLITFYTNNAERMRILGDGVGLGRSDPQARLDVNGSILAATDGGFAFRNDPDSGMFTTGNDANTLAFRTAAVNRMFLTIDGRLGIGTSSPIAPLHVVGYTLNSFNFQAYMDANGVSASPSETRADLQHTIVAEKRMRAEAYDVASDARIKTALGRSDTRADLATLLKLEVTDYTFKDPIAGGRQSQKKVIAQQVETAFPQAVSRTVNVVPDIFVKASIAHDGWITLATSLKVGERVRLLADGKQDLHEVRAVEAGRFQTTLKPASEQVFVYGREVSDFRVVDYDAIAMLNVSATQQIKHEKDAEVKALRDENATLRTRLAALEAKDQARDVKLAAIEQLLRSAAGVVARPAASAGANGQD